MRRRLFVVTATLVLATGCSSDGAAPDAVCASPPGETLTECKDSGSGEGPLTG